MAERTKQMDGRAAATLVGIVAILLWSSLALLTAMARGIPPFELLALSFLVAFLASMSLLAWRGAAGFGLLRQPWPAWATGFAGIFLYHALYFFALTAAPPAEASLINYLWPLLIVLFSAAAARTRLQGRYVAGALLGLAGTALIVTQSGAGDASTRSLLGYAAAFAAAFVWSGYSVANRRFAHVPSAVIGGVCGLVALAGAACHLAVETSVAPNAQQWAVIMALGLGPVGLAFFAWDRATKHGSLPLLGSLSYLAPLLSTLLLIAFGEAQASPALLGAAILIILGAAVATLGPRRTGG
jgi:drug/metabolite transporter (DMT)-like permease